MNKSFPKFSLTHHLYISWDGFASDDDRTKRCNNTTAGHSFLSHQTDEWNIVFWLSSLYGVISTLFCWIYKFQQFIQKYRTISKKSLSYLPTPALQSLTTSLPRTGSSGQFPVRLPELFYTVREFHMYTYTWDRQKYTHTYISIS